MAGAMGVTVEVVKGRVGVVVPRGAVGVETTKRGTVKRLGKRGRKATGLPPAKRRRGGSQRKRGR